MAEFTAFNIIPEEDDEDTTNLRDNWRKMAGSGGSLSFAKILELINAQGTGTDNETKLQNLRKQLQQAYGAVAEKDEDGRPIYLTPDGKTVVYKEESWRYTDDNAEEYKGERSKLRLMRQDSQSGEWNSNEHSDFVNKFYGFLDQHELTDSNVASEEVMAQAGVLMMLDDKAIEFFSGQKDKTELWESYVANNSHCWKNRLKKDVDDKNLPKYELFKDNHLKCTYENIGGGDLSVTVVDSKLSILTKGNEAQTIDKITASQYKALLDILQDNGNIIKIDDKTKEILQKIKVVTDDGSNECAIDKDHPGLTSLYDHLVEDSVTDQDSDYAESINGCDGKEETTDEVSHAASGNASGGTSAPSSEFQDDNAEMDSYQFLSVKASIDALDREGRKEVRDEFLKKFKEEHVDNVVKTRLGIDGFEIACWGSEEDERKDGRIDPKTGIKAKTKMFGCKFRYGPPPSATLTTGNLKKLSKTDAGAVLKGLKVAGAEYVKLPNKDKIGAESYKNFLLASINAGVVPRLPTYKDDPKGTPGFGEGEAKAVWEQITKETTSTKVMPYLLKMAEQMDICQRGGGGKLGSYPTYFRTYARFYYFQLNNLEVLQGFRDGKSGVKFKNKNGEWVQFNKENTTKEDYICAKYAVTQIIKNINLGKLPKLDENGNFIKDASGKLLYEAYDPIDKDGKNKDKLTAVMSAYMAEEKPKVIEAVKKALNDPTRLTNDEDENTDPEDDNNITSPKSSVYRDVEKVYDGEFNEVVKNVMGGQAVDLKGAVKDLTATSSSISDVRVAPRSQGRSGGRP